MSSSSSRSGSTRSGQGRSGGDRSSRSGQNRSGGDRREREEVGEEFTSRERPTILEAARVDAKLAHLKADPDPPVQPSPPVPIPTRMVEKAVSYASLAKILPADPPGGAPKKSGGAPSVPVKKPGGAPSLPVKKPGGAPSVPVKKPGGVPSLPVKKSSVQGDPSQASGVQGDPPSGQGAAQSASQSSGVQGVPSLPMKKSGVQGDPSQASGVQGGPPSGQGAAQSVSQSSGVQGGPSGGQGAAPKSDPLPKLKDDFKHLLTTKGKVAEGKSYYEHRATVMANLTKSGEKSYVLDVDFNHLLNDDRYLPLAVQCSKDLEKGDMWHGWLQPIARDFLNCQFGLEEQEKAGLEFRFLHEPRSVKPLTRYSTSKLVKKEGIFNDEFERRKTTYAGRQVYLAIVHNVLGEHSEGNAFDGKFNADNIYIILYEEGIYASRIVGDRKINADLSEKVADLQRMDVVVTPKYELEGMYPDYFTALHEDLNTLTVRKLRDSGLLLYLPFHFAFMTPTARRFLLWEFYLFTQSPRLDSEIARDEYDSIFRKEFGTDWRIPYKLTKEPILEDVYHHDNPGADPMKAKGENVKASKGSKPVRNKDKFDITVQGCLDYERHVVQHAYNHKAGTGDDSELFAAWKIPDLLPCIFRALFKGKKMKLQKVLGRIWEHYCLMRDAIDEEN